ncbi:hypothetical protein D8770_28210 [Methylobacterium sp. DB1607]|nr:hypothetical protein [Methylobacterium sp. DB1607]
MPWAVLIRRDNQLDGKREFLAGNGYFNRLGSHPCPTALFTTRDEARAAIREHLTDLRQRPDLRGEPFGWLAPIPVRVAVEVRLLSSTSPGA